MSKELTKLNSFSNNAKDAGTSSHKFKKGDKVFHKNLEKEGIFAEYDWTGEHECHVIFLDEDGYEDCRHVSTNQLIPL